jgi:hypothetical protein
MSEDKKPFTVTDRRHFNPEGESRPEAEVAPETKPEPEAEAGGIEDDDQGGPMIPTDLPGLIVMFATQASMLLAPAAEDGPPDVEGARAFIGLLEMLQEKTRGNRTPEEDRLLEDVLYQLRMAFVAQRRSRA